MTEAVRVEKVVKTYVRGRQPVDVLHGLDLQVAEGAFAALMGPSGSGKTTLLNLIAGLDRPTSGNITVGGARIDAMSSRALAAWRARHVGFVFQAYHLMPVLTAERNVELPLLLTNATAGERKRKVAAALELVGLHDRARHKPRELSGGQQQRVSIARAIVADPPLLVCDEPTGDLDRESADGILGLLQLLNREYGKTLLMVTHDPQAAEYATYQVRLDKGRLVTAHGAMAVA
ncbi:MAG TPA: ABC transporter ATP-binding protein [Thermoanaerobaculia bacterium]